MLRSLISRATILGGLGFTALLASNAGACANDGLSGPCHCAARAAMFNVPVPAAVTNLTGATTIGGSGSGAAGFSGSSINGAASTASGDYLPLSFGFESGNTPASTTTVHVFNFDFSTNAAGGMVMDAVIHVGDTVHWQWDSGTHSVTTVAGSFESFDSGNKSATSGTFDHTFNTPGVVQYFCDIHGFDNGDGTAGGMAGTITILPVPEPATAMFALVALVPMLIRRKSRG